MEYAEMLILHQNLSGVDEYRNASDPQMKELNWPLLPERVKYRQAQLVLTAVNVLAPDYMRALFSIRSRIFQPQRHGNCKMGHACLKSTSQ